MKSAQLSTFAVSRRACRRGVVSMLGVVSLACLAVGACGRDSSRPPSSPAATPHKSAHGGSYGEANQIPLPQSDQRLCTAVAILLDTSGSMGEKIGDRGGARTPKHKLAGQALERIVLYTGEWRKAHPDRAIQLGVFSFSSSAKQVLPMAEFNLDQAQAALRTIAKPGGGTAIGNALIDAFSALYQSGCVRKYLICITDGENTVGAAPDRVARQLYSQTHGEVEIHFVAFDTSAEKFGFLTEVNGYTVEAADGMQLDSRLSEIYEKRILAEAMPAEKQ